MIELVPAEHDDLDFLSLAQRIINGAVVELQMREVFLVQIDNWFDHKWLGWRSRKQGLRIPMFTSNRVRSEMRLTWNEESSAWTTAGMSRPLHLRQAGRPWLAQTLERYSKSAAFVWYSGNSGTNKAGSLMLYLSGADNYSWYASFQKAEEWIIDDECRVTRRELLLFEERGRILESAQATNLYNFSERQPDIVASPS